MDAYMNGRSARHLNETIPYGAGGKDWKDWAATRKRLGCYKAWQESQAENTRLRAAIETAAAMVRHADPDLSNALLRTLVRPKDG